MTELNWEPAQISRLTIPQLVCLGHPKTPGETMSPDKWAEYFERKKREDTEWAAS